MPSTSKLAKAILKLRGEIAREIAREAAPPVPADPIASAAEYRAWRRQWPNAATLLDTIVFRWQIANAKIKGVPGVWAAYPVEDWVSWSKLRLRTVERCLASLVADGLIERERHRFGGSKVRTFVRPTARALQLAGKVDTIHRLGDTPSDPVGGTVGGTDGGTGGGTDYTYSTTLPLSTINKVGDAYGIATGPDQFQDDEGSEQEKEEPPAPTTVAEAWQQAVAKNYPGKAVKPLTGKEHGQLTKLAKDCPEGHALDVVECIVAKWIAFTERAASREGAFDSPADPLVAFASKFRESAVNFWLDKNGLIIVDGKPVPKPEPKPVASKFPAMPVSAGPAKPAEQMATLADILAPYEPEPEQMATLEDFLYDLANPPK